MNTRTSARGGMTITMAGILALAGAAIGAPEARAAAVLVANPAGPINFGDQRINTTSLPVTIGFTNTDGVTYATGIVCAIENDGGFHETGDFSPSGCPTSLAAGEEFDVDVTFTALDAGPRGAKLHVVYDDGTNSQALDVSLRGFGIQGPDLVVNGDWSDVDLGSQHVAAGATDPARIVTMANTSETNALQIDAYTKTGSDCDQFDFSFPGTPTTIAAGGSSTFSVSFDPSSAGTKSCVVTFTSDDPDPPTQLTVTGTGLAPHLVLSPASPHSFGSRRIGAGATAAFAVTMNNDAAANDDLSFIPGAFDATADPDCAHFVFVFPDTPLLLAPGESDDFTARFDPSTVGTKTCDVYIISNDPASPHSYRFTGTGSASNITLSPDPCDWGSVVVDSTVTRAVVVTNVAGSTANLALSDLTLSGTNAGTFGVVSPTSFPIVLSPGSSQTVSLSCTPTSTGSKTATLTVSHDADITTNDDATLNCTGVISDPVVIFEDGFESGDTSAWTAATGAIWQPAPDPQRQLQLSGATNSSAGLGMSNGSGGDMATNEVTVSSAGTLGVHYYVPVAAKASGAPGTFFLTDLDIQNGDTNTATYQFLWLPRGEDNSTPQASATFNLAAGAAVRYRDVLGTVFGFGGNAVGALAILSDSSDLAMMSRTYNAPHWGGTFGQVLPGYRGDQLITTGQRRKILFFTENDEFRSNLGLLNGTGDPIQIMWERFAPDGSLIDTEMMTLPPWGNTQLNRVFSDVSPVEGASIQVWTPTAGGAFAAYGSVLDNETSDPTTVLPQ